MPRARKPGSGGPRSGTPGASYQNRTDLNQARQPVTTVPNQEYGKAKEQQILQKSAPMPDNTTVSQAPPQSASVGAGPAGPIAGGLGAFDRATERSGEPITAGLDIGAGPGSEALQREDPDEQDIAALRGYLPALEIMANLPSSSIETRNFVRRIRGGMPMQQEGMQLPEMAQQSAATPPQPGAAPSDAPLPPATGPDTDAPMQQSDPMTQQQQPAPQGATE